MFLRPWVPKAHKLRCFCTSGLQNTSVVNVCLMLWACNTNQYFCLVAWCLFLFSFLGGLRVACCGHWRLQCLFGDASIIDFVFHDVPPTQGFMHVGMVIAKTCFCLCYTNMQTYNANPSGPPLYVWKPMPCINEYYIDATGPWSSF